jgi:hypothetical protein
MTTLYFHSEKLFTKYDWDSEKWLPELFEDPFLISKKNKEGYIYKVIVKHKTIEFLMFDAYKYVEEGIDLKDHNKNCIYRYHNDRYTNHFKPEIKTDETIKSYACMDRRKVYFDEVYEIKGGSEFQLLLVDLENE